MAVLAALEGLLKRLGLGLGRLEGILDRLGGILGRLGSVSRPLGGLRVCRPVARWWARRGLLLGSFRNFPDLIRIIRNIWKDFIRVWDSVRHAQAKGLARRILQRSKAAIPPPRLENKNYTEVE